MPNENGWVNFMERYRNMQKLLKRNTYTLWSTSQASDICDLILNSLLGVMNSVSNLKTFDNSLDVNLLQLTGGLKTDMLVCGGDKCPP